MARGSNILRWWSLLLLGAGFSASSGERSALAEERAPQKPSPKDSEIPQPAAKLLGKLLSDVGVDDAPLERVERSLERQARVMYDLARSDLNRAREMYCDAGDAVLDRFDPKASEGENLSRMQTELSAQLPRARELGCLNHVENDQVYSVDVLLEAIPEARRDAFEKAARRAVREGEVERFLLPPTHPDAYHFEFRQK